MSIKLILRRFQINILIASSIDEDAISQLSLEHNVRCEFNASENKLISLIQDQDVLIFRSGVQISRQVLESGKKLRLILRAGSGVDNINLEAVKDLNLHLIRIPQPGAKAVAELTFALMLALSRELLRADSSTRKGEWLKYQLSGYLLTGKVLGIIGVGNIGSRVGNLGSNWGMKVIGYDIIDTPDFRDGLINKGIKSVEFEEVLSRADYLSLHVPLAKDTRNMIGEKELGEMKPGSYLINIARGGIVNERALYQELTTENRLRGAGLDVHELEGEGNISPLADLPNVVLTPHIGAMTIDSQKEIGTRILSAINEFSNSRKQ